MKKLIFLMIFISSQAFANDCSALAPEEGFFTEDSVLRFYSKDDAWMDVCFELSGDPVDLQYCTVEALKWDKFLDCESSSYEVEVDGTPFLENVHPALFGAFQD